MKNRQQDLKRGLLPRHVQFIALAGMIGTGIFKGSSDTLSIAGPGVVFAYLLGGLLLFIVMSALAEMAIAHPNSNVQHLIDKAFGFHVSFIAGWLYWINWTIVIIVEILAAGSFLQYWFPAIPLWLLSLLCASFIFAINFVQVKYYGEIEFWFAAIKILALTAFIVLGCLLLTNIIPGQTIDALSHYTDHGGFFPHGITGVLSALLVVMFSYGGAELIGVAVTETKNAEQVLPKVVKGTMWRVILFYMLPMLIICGLMPWDKVTGENSPFVQVLDMTGLPGAAHIMNFVLVTAVLSAANSGVYATSRMLYSMAQNGEAPKALLKVNKQGVPIIGLTIAAICIIIGLFLAYIAPGQIISYLMSIPGFTVLLLWIGICLAQLKLRFRYQQIPAFHVKGFPYLTSFAALSLSAIFISFLFNQNNWIGSAVCLVTLCLLILFSFIVKAKTKQSNKPTDRSAANL
ncbi:amino acid permease family protein [Anoxybacillus sp. B7M1]|jgi:amino acid transporter, AAT family|uniref:amino acid permease n=1 Tax=unclassified Anoxybacillus TaxID=2639704 RepID=UPI0005CDA5CB|nr:MULTISPECIES: amino acid permease [unclassified Anoxybacillus]ANB56686.1 amino acid permease family protein [Anoxybacillus sp. B2M1]ANB63247.1 amino acid permease family protein [Anoxybacillus sp. B7M1]